MQEVAGSCGWLRLLPPLRPPLASSAAGLLSAAGLQILCTSVQGWQCRGMQLPALPSCRETAGVPLQQRPAADRLLLQRNREAVEAAAEEVAAAATCSVLHCRLQRERRPAADRRGGLLQRKREAVEAAAGEAAAAAAKRLAVPVPPQPSEAAAAAGSDGSDEVAPLSGARHGCRWCWCCCCCACAVSLTGCAGALAGLDVVAAGRLGGRTACRHKAGARFTPPDGAVPAVQGSEEDSDYDSDVSEDAAEAAAEARLQVCVRATCVWGALRQTWQGALLPPAGAVGVVSGSRIQGYERPQWAQASWASCLCTLHPSARSCLTGPGGAFQHRCFLRLHHRQGRSLGRCQTAGTPSASAQSARSARRPSALHAGL